MAVNSRLHGKTGQVQWDPAGGGAYVTLADIKSWTLDASKDRVDATAFGDVNKIKVVGLPDFSGTLGGFWNAATSPALWAVILGTAVPTLKLVPNTADPTYFFKGLANLDGSLTVDNAGVVAFSAKWDAAGNWTMLP
jgi:hypothetical protein